jgi:hypothetical protein
MLPTEIFEKRILISPLNWGMGHVARCIPLIKKLKKQNNRLFIACSNNQKKIIESYVSSNLAFIEHEGYPFRFKGQGNFVLDIFFNIIELKNRHELEFSQVNDLVDKFGIEIIISDHRYGFRSEKCKSIFMTHQLILPLPWFLKAAQWWHKKQVSKFDFQWIVDDESERLAGKLSDKSGFPNAKYIGNLSRFDQAFIETKKEYKGVLIISGPSAYYLTLFDRFKQELTNGEIDLIVGNEIAYQVFKNLNSKIAFHHSKNWTLTDELIIKSKKIFGFCGYSTLMDIQFLKCDSDLIACPGQLEQLYLQKKSRENSGL